MRIVSQLEKEMNNTDALSENLSSSSSAQSSAERSPNVVLHPQNNVEILARHVAASEAIHHDRMLRSSFDNTSAALNNIDIQTRLLLLQQPSLLGTVISNNNTSNLAITAQHNVVRVLHPDQRAGEQASATMPQLEQMPSRTNTSRMLFGENLIDDELLRERTSGISEAEQITNYLLQQQRDDQYLLTLLHLQQRQQMQREDSDRMQLEQLLRTSSSATAASSVARRGMESGGFRMGLPATTTSTSPQIDAFLSQMRDLQLMRQIRADDALRSEAAAMDQSHLLLSQVSGYPSMPSLTGAGLTGSRSSTFPLLQQTLRLHNEGSGSPLSTLDQHRSLSPFCISYQDHVRHGATRRAEYIKMEAQNETTKRSSLPDTRGLKIYPSQNSVGLDSITSRAISSSFQDALPRITKESNDRKISGKPKAKAVKPHHEANYEVDEREQPDANAEVEETTCIETFPHILYRMLNEEEKEGNAHIVSFFPHGCSFGIHKPQQFVNSLLPKYFTTGRMSSFQRQLNLYSFHRITNGPEKGGYWHENFIKDIPSLCKSISRKKTVSKPTTNPSLTSMQTPPESFTAAAVAMSDPPVAETAAAVLRQVWYGSSTPSMGGTHHQGRQRPIEGINESNIVDNAISHLLVPERLNIRHQLQQAHQSGTLNEQQLLSSLLLGDNAQSTSVINTRTDRDLIQVLLQQLIAEQEQQRQRQQRDNNPNNNPE